MANNADTGNGTTVAFGTTGFTAYFTQVAIGEMSLEALEDSYLSTATKKTFMPSDLYDAGEAELTFWWNQSFSTFPAMGTVETLTLTFPLKSGESTPGTLAGTGFIAKVKPPTVQNGQLMVGSVTFKWDGKTGPTYTKGS